MFKDSPSSCSASHIEVSARGTQRPKHRRRLGPLPLPPCTRVTGRGGPLRPHRRQAPHGLVASEVGRDNRGFVVTDRDLTRGEVPPGGTPSAWCLDRSPLPLETGMPGVFAAGDARRQSMNRVAPAVGDGALADNPVREYLNFWA